MTDQNPNKCGCGCEETISEKAQKAYHSVKEGATKAVDYAKEKTQEAYDTAEEIASKVKHSLTDK